MTQYTELRAGCCKLEVEMGRWRGNKREDRICKLCGERIKDEKHFKFQRCVQSLICIEIGGERKGILRI